jgi:C4-dicarboxylate-specific signal transduction histidine kinase
LQRESVDVKELMREMTVLLRSEANCYSIAIRAELAEELPNVMADSVRLQQVFINRMLNGIDAMRGSKWGCRTDDHVVASQPGSTADFHQRDRRGSAERSGRRDL